MLPLDNAVNEEKVLSGRRIRLAVLKNVKKPARKADPKVRWAQS